MSVNREKIAEFNQKEIYQYTLDNGKGSTAQILNYGGIIKKLIYKDIDVVLGRDTFEEYLNNDGYFGAIIGRNSNRIENSEFELSGKVYNLYRNDGRNNLHGGRNGFDKKVWDAEIVDGEEPSLILHLISPDGEEGFPGEVEVKVKYTLTADNSLRIHYEGKTDADTILNMTNHSYFNLNGHLNGTINGHKLWINSDFYTPNTNECMPYGEVLNVNGTPFDFNSNETLGERFKSDHIQITMFGGFDHNFVLNGRGYRKVACLRGDKSGISMEVYTDRNGMQLYTGNMIDDNCVYKDKIVYSKHSGLCLETQAFPNSMRYSHFPNGILRKSEKYNTVTVYKFL